MKFYQVKEETINGIDHLQSSETPPISGFLLQGDVYNHVIPYRQVLAKLPLDCEAAKLTIIDALLFCARLSLGLHAHLDLGEWNSSLGSTGYGQAESQAGQQNEPGCHCLYYSKTNVKFSTLKLVFIDAQRCT